MEFGIGNDLESTRVMTPREDGFAQTVEKNKYRLFLAEMFGMMTFVGLSLSNVAVYSLFPSNMSWEGVAIAWGFNLLLGILTHVSLRVITSWLAISACVSSSSTFSQKC